MGIKGRGILMFLGKAGSAQVNFHKKFTNILLVHWYLFAKSVNIYDTCHEKIPLFGVQNIVILKPS